jgi:hypothetical protein
VGAHIGQPPLHLANARTHHALIEFELRLPRAAHTNTALLAVKVSPAADQAGGEVLQLSQLHLQLTLMGARALSEDIEDQAGPR